MELLFALLLDISVSTLRSSVFMFECLALLDPPEPSMGFAVETWLEGRTAKLAGPYEPPPRPRAPGRAGVPQCALAPIRPRQTRNSRHLFSCRCAAWRLASRATRLPPGTLMPASHALEFLCIWLEGLVASAGVPALPHGHTMHM